MFFLHVLQKSDSLVRTSQNAYCASKMAIYCWNASSGFRNWQIAKILNAQSIISTQIVHYLYANMHFWNVYNHNNRK